MQKAALLLSGGGALRFLMPHYLSLCFASLFLAPVLPFSFDHGKCARAILVVVLQQLSW
jgi:hypothetical protein